MVAATLTCIFPDSGLHGRLLHVRVLHALVFAALCGVPPVAISYDPKVDGLMEQLGLAAATSVDRFDAARLGRAITEAWGQRERVSGMLAARAPELRSLALRNIELALSLLPRR